MQVTLRIKRRYFDRIAAGEKRVEYRDATAFYDRLLGGKRVTALKLHYQGEFFLTAPVKAIRKIKTPKALQSSSIPFSERVYAIHLGGPVRVHRARR